MIEPAWGPFLFDTSAESWFARASTPYASRWWRAYLSLHSVHVSAITVVERVRGYAALSRNSDAQKRPRVEEARMNYLASLGTVWPADTATAIVAGEIIALLPEPPTPPRRSHRGSESRSDRLARWRFDSIVAATALVTGMALIHRNPGDFEAIRGAIENSPDRFPHLGPLNLMRCGSVPGE